MTSQTHPSEMERLERRNALLCDEKKALQLELETLRRKFAEVVEDAERAQEQCEVLENFCFGLEREYEQSVITRETFLALEEEAAKLQEHNEVLENVCFGLEQEHERARLAVEEAQQALASNYRTLQELKEQQDDILGNVSQGIITLTPSAGFLINPEHSRRAGELLGEDLTGRSFPELFAGDEERRNKLERFLKLLSDSPWVSDSMVERLNPLQEIAWRRDGDIERVLAFSFVRMAATREGEASKDAKIMVVFDDKTAERRLEQALQRQLDEYTTRIERIYRILTLPRDAFESFAEDATALVATLRAGLDDLEHTGDRSGTVAGLLRSAHTLKGHARALGLVELTGFTHELESLLERFPTADGPGSLEAIRQVLAKVSAELEDSRAIVARVAEVGATLSRERIRGGRDELEPMLRGLVQQTARELGKTVELDYRNELQETPALLRRVVQTVLVHIVSNAVVHGIERGPQRHKEAKPTKGRIEVEVRAELQGVQLRCRDDGRGLDAESIRRVAIERGVIDASDAQLLSAEDVHRLIFRPGVSTAMTTTVAAGRGVGMDAVFDAVRSLGGRIDVRSEPGQFTEFCAWLPRDSISPDSAKERSGGHP
jgi:two-component system, chemotaxis family, sensor kinase CheA